MTILATQVVLAIALTATAEPEVAPPRFDAQGQAIGQPLSDRVVSYDIQARLDPAKRTVTGSEVLTWRNRSSEPQATLWFHLYWNAFKNNRSTFYRDARALGGIRDPDSDDPDYPDREKEDWGYSDIKAISIRGGEDLLPNLQFQHPDDDNADDQTVFTVTLPSTIAPGASVTLDIHWEARVPKAVARAGYAGDYYLVSQWFPKIGVLEVPPERGVTSPRWNCHQYHATTEFYADFGTYHVRLTVPKQMKVGATGVRVDRTENADGTTTYRYHQDDVHDFAWTAWEMFDEVEDVFRHAGMPEVKITLLSAPEHRPSQAQALQAVRASLAHYGEWWFPWPYPHLTVVDPPTEGIETSGMEYPTFITTDLRAEPGDKDFVVWEVTAHEFGHNYWYGLVASNEFEEAWLDEGINSYGTGKLLIAEDVSIDTRDLLFPRALRRWFSGLPRFGGTDRERAINKTWSSPVVLPGWKYRTQGDYGVNSYTRPELNLFALEAELGSETMAKVMKTYAERWRFKHPRSEDFFATAEEVSGKDLKQFWEAFFRGTGTLDYRVSKLSCDELDPDRRAGVFEVPRGREIVEPPKGGGDSAAIEHCVVELDRVGDVQLPVRLKVTFDDGTVQEESWDGLARWTRFTYDRPGKGGAIKQVELDDRGPLALDATPFDNSRTRRADTQVAVETFGWLTYLGQLIASLASLVI